MTAPSSDADRASDPTKALSKPNVAANNGLTQHEATACRSPSTSRRKSHAGMFMATARRRADGVLSAYDAAGNLICREQPPVPESYTEFIGLYDPRQADRHGDARLRQDAAEQSIDDLYFTYNPAPVTPVVTPSPTDLHPTPTDRGRRLSPCPTSRPIVAIPSVLQPDLSIFGIEFTQGIQCFDTSQVSPPAPTTHCRWSTRRTPPRASICATRACCRATSPACRCACTSLPTAWVHRQRHGQGDHIHQPRRADAAGSTSTSTSTTTSPSPSMPPVDLPTPSARVQRGQQPLSGIGDDQSDLPQGATRSRSSASGCATTRQGTPARRTPPAGRSTAAPPNYMEQLMPIRNNGIDYSIRSGYLTGLLRCHRAAARPAATTSTPDPATFNSLWILQNAPSWMFGSDFLGADHVYGWVPNAGYPCGRADMPVYPHAGGLGVVGIGTDAPGTTTDTPGAGSYIMVHELFDYDLKYTNTADACGSNDSSSAFPYGSSSIQEFGFNPLTGKIYNPNNTR